MSSGFQLAPTTGKSIKEEKETRSDEKGRKFKTSYLLLHEQP